MSRYDHKTYEGRRKQVDYPWLRRWAFHVGSPQQVVEDTVELALATQAPHNAIMPMWSDGACCSERYVVGWYTTDDIGNPLTRSILGLA